MSPFRVRELPPVIDAFDPSDLCCGGCGAYADPDGLCDTCIARREEFGAHRPECRCDGCIWYAMAEQALRARGLR